MYVGVHVAFWCVPFYVHICTGKSRGARSFIYTMNLNMCEEVNILTRSLCLSLSLSPTLLLSHSLSLSHTHILQNFVYTFWSNKVMSMPKDSTPKDSSMNMSRDWAPRYSSGPGGNGGEEGGLSIDGGVGYFVQAKDWNCNVDTRLKKYKLSSVCFFTDLLTLLTDRNATHMTLRHAHSDIHLHAQRIHFIAHTHACR